MSSLRPLLRATLLTFLALIGGGLLLVTLTVIITSLHTYMLTPADLLPAEATRALFSMTDSTFLRQYEPWIPILQNLPPSSTPQTIAVVDLQKEGEVLVSFTRRPLSQEVFLAKGRWTQRDIGPFTVTASSPAIFPLLEHPTSPLRVSQAYALLSRGQPEKQPWVFLEKAVLPPALSLEDKVLESLLLMRGATHLGIIPRGGSGTTMMLFPMSTEQRPSSLPPTPYSLHLAFSLAFAAPAANFQTLKTHLPSTNRMVLETELLTLLKQTFGNDVSLDYDLLPLLTHPARLTLATTASGTMVFLLQGRAEHAVERLTRLHDAFRGSLTTARVVTRIFDRGRYVFRNVREDETLLKDESYSLSGIQVRATSHAEQRGLFSSTTGQEFLLSNDRKMLEQMIQAQTSERVTYALAAGSFSPPSLASFLGGRLPTVLNPPSPLLPKETDTFDWSLTRQGDVATLTFTRAF